MGKKTKLREAQRHAAEHALAARLRERSRAKSRSGFITTYSDFSAEYRERIERYRKFALRAPEGWSCSLRVRSPECRFLDLVRFCFFNYPVPRHLENPWLMSEVEAGLLRAPLCEGDHERPDARNWSIIVGRGGSLYDAGTHAYMSRSETHHFVTAPHDVIPTQRAFWYAFARSQTCDAAAGLRVARTKLINFNVTNEFWRDVARFFVRNPTSILEMNDLIDFIAAAREADPRFSLAGRRLPALRRRMAEWHRNDQVFPDGPQWDGHSLPNADCTTGGGGDRACWRFRQLKSVSALARDGAQKAHCVLTYLSLCTSGAISIWTLTCERPAGNVSIGVTIELRKDGTITQCRGYGNRPPTAEEAAMVKGWARKHGLTWDAYELDAA
jgi:hypothetical protein